MKRTLLFVLVALFSGFVHAQFTLPTLPYAYNALEPSIDAQTMEIHYSKHHQTYITNLNKAVAGTDAANKNIIEILNNISSYSEVIRNNAGGHYNHSLFWTVLTPQANTQPSAELLGAIKEQFTSLDSLKKRLNQAAATRFGSGWAWLIVTPDKKLAVCSTPNQDNPLMDIATEKGTPILGIDVWEHAYYLKYQNKRGDYLAAIWNVINWAEVSKRYNEVVPKPVNPFDKWPAMKMFQKVMSQTFHAAEEGNFKPIKAKSEDLMLKAQGVLKGNVPAKFNTKTMQADLKMLESQAKKVNSLVKKKADDSKLMEGLNALHETFHKIIGACILVE